MGWVPSKLVWILHQTGTLIGREVLAYTDCDYVGIPARDFSWWPAVARVGGGLRDSGQDSIAALRLSLEQSHGVILWSTGACLHLLHMIVTTGTRLITNYCI